MDLKDLQATTMALSREDGGQVTFKISYINTYYLVLLVFHYDYVIELYQNKQIALFGGKRWLALVDLSSPNCQVNHLNII